MFKVFAENAQQLWENGYSIIPIKPNTKISISDWSDYCQEQASEAKLEEWKNKLRNYGIGLALGKASKTIAIDVDVDEDHEAYQAIISCLPPAVVKKRGRKGFTAFYQYNGHASGGIDFNGQRVVDILSDGRQTVLPPTHHPKGEPYKWLTAKTLNTIYPYELGEISLNIREEIQQALTKLPKQKTEAQQTTSGRHDKLLGMAFAAIGKNKTEKEIVSELVGYDNKMHNPPYFKDKKEPFSGENGPANFVKNVMKTVKRKNPELEIVKESNVITNNNFELQKKKDGSIICNMNNVVKVLSSSEEFKDLIFFDKFYNRFVNKKESRFWEDQDALDVIRTLQSNYGLSTVPKSIVIDGIEAFAYENASDSLIDYFNSLYWDGVPRVDSFLFLGMGAEDNIYNNAVSRNMLIAIAGRALCPGIKFDHMTIFEGGQGTKKSTALETLGGKFFKAVHGNIANKDFLVDIQGALIVELGELASMNKSEINDIKKVLSTREDCFRPPYGRNSVTLKRRAVFFGTTNDSEYLRDPTGNRRFWPITTGDINLEYIESNRDQILAEAAVRFRAGECYYEVPKEAFEIQNSKLITDPWEAAILKWYDDQHKSEVTINDILSKALEFNISTSRGFEHNRVSSILKKNGFTSSRKRISGRDFRFWFK